MYAPRSALAGDLTEGLVAKHGGRTDDAFRNEARQLGLTLKKDNEVRRHYIALCRTSGMTKCATGAQGTTADRPNLTGSASVGRSGGTCAAQV
jgi:hypothetical protein